MTDEPHGFSTAEVMERHYGLGSAKLPAKLRLRPSPREILEQARQANPDALNASAALLPHKTRDEMIAEAEARLKGDDYADRSVQSFLGLAEAAKDDELRVGTQLTSFVDANLVRRKYAKQHILDLQNKNNEAKEYLRTEEFKCQALLDEMLKDPALVAILGEFRINSVHLIPPPAQASYLGYRKRDSEDNDTLPVLDVFISRWDRQPVTQPDLVRLYTALQPQFPEIYLQRKLQNSGISGAHAPERASTPLFDRKTHGALASAGGDALLTMTSQQVRESSPILETLEDITKNHFAVRATDARVFRPEGGWPAEFGGTVLGHPLGQDNGDHNGELESGFKYQMQIHPLTGETRNQMLVRTHPFIRTAHLGGHLALDYSNLPVDLVFDEQCGVRWKTEAEMLQTQQEVDTIFEQAQVAQLPKPPAEVKVELNDPVAANLLKVRD
jgi:hypothetical protein